MGTYTKEQLETELNRIKNAVASCRTAIYNKGVASIPDNVTLAELPTYVNMIECSHPDILLRWIGTGDGDINTMSDVYFDTGLQFSYDITFDTMCLKPNTDTNVLFGASNSGLSFFFIPNYDTYAFWTQNQLRRYNFYATGALSNIDTNFYHFSSADTFEYTSNFSVYAGSNQYTTTPGTGTESFTSGNTLYIWARNNGTSVNLKATYGSKLKYLCFFKGGDLARFYVPVLHWTNGEYVPCLYDTVNDTYSYNLGTGTPNYESTGAYLLDYYYYASEKPASAGFLTTSIILQNMRLYTKFVSYGTSNINEQTVFACRQDGANKYGIYSTVTGGASVIQKIGVKYKSSSALMNLYGPDLTEGTEYKVSFFSNEGKGSKMFVNDTEYTASTDQTSDATIIGNPLYILGNQIVVKNTRCYYAIANDLDRNATKFWVPVYDKNDSNPIKYVDVRHETVARYTGNTANLGYQLLD